MATTETKTPSTGITASKRELAKGAGIAAAIAAVVLTFFVLPSEYGIDPTGVGGALGLTALHAPPPEGAAANPTPAPAPTPAGATGTIAGRQQPAYRSDTKQITLPPGKGLEIKTTLDKGAALVYSWKTEGGEVVNHDFHGEPLGAKDDEYESFIKERGVSESRGMLIAPFPGTHGWFWGNKTDKPIVVTLNASGFYTDIVEK